MKVILSTKMIQKMSFNGAEKLFIRPHLSPRTTALEGYKSPTKAQPQIKPSGIPPKGSNVRLFSTLWNSLSSFTYSTALLPYLIEIGELETSWSINPDLLNGKVNNRMTNFQLGSIEYSIAANNLRKLRGEDASFSHTFDRLDTQLKNSASAPLFNQLARSVAWFKSLASNVAQDYNVTADLVKSKGPSDFDNSPGYAQINEVYSKLIGTPFKRRLLITVMLIALHHRFGRSWYYKKQNLTYPYRVLGLPPTAMGTPDEPVVKKVDTLGGWPLTDRYGKVRAGGKIHLGLDIAADEGTMLYAPFSGKVTTGNDAYNGNWVAIKNDTLGRYKMIHLAKLLVKDTPLLAQGQALGTVGNTGVSRGTHLHLTYMAPGTTTEVDPIGSTPLASMSALIFTPDAT